MIILGGEATVDPNFFKKLKFIEKVTKENHIFTILTTNGYMLKNKNFLHKIATSSIDSINISVMNHNYEKNNDLMGVKTLKKEELREIYKVLHRYGKTVRLNTNVAKNNLSTIKEIEDYIRFYKGCYDVIKFTPLMNTDMFNTINRVLKYTHTNTMSKIEIKELFDSLVNKYNKNLDNNKVFGLINYTDLNIFGEHIILKYEQVEDM